MTTHDGFGRTIDYLRISVTDRCNLRCLYCMPEEGVPGRTHQEILRYEEIARLTRIAVDLGVRKVRITGGEPLVRPGLVSLVAMLRDIPGIEDLALTTNGTLLAPQAADLAAAGLDRVNVSLDSLQPERFARLTRGGRLQDTLDGLEAARRAGLHPIKINMVVVRGLNDDEVMDFARLTLDGWRVRFLEVMPLGEGAHWGGDGFIATAEVRGIIEDALGPLEPVESDPGGPARSWRVPGAAGEIGFISPVSEHFCGYCNRLRLTAEGRLLPCLFGTDYIDLRAALRGGADDGALRELLLRGIAAKPSGHHLDEGQAPTGRQMSGIGG